MRFLVHKLLIAARILLVIILFLPFSLKSQALGFNGKTAAVYVSSSEFVFNEDYYMLIAQYLKIGEDRSWGENEKSELLIRIGEQFTTELQRISGFDSVYFLNADIEKGKSFIRTYEPGISRLGKLGPEFKGTDYIFVLEKLALTTRKVNSVFIRSNRIHTQKVDVLKGEIKILLFRPGKAAPLRQVEAEVNERDQKPSAIIIDFHSEESRMGKFLSRLFTLAWSELKGNGS